MMNIKKKELNEIRKKRLVLYAAPSIKKYNIARFDTQIMPQLKSLLQPVKMYRDEPDKVKYSDEEEDENGNIVSIRDKEVGNEGTYNPFKQKRRRKRKDTRTRRWIIEDSMIPSKKLVGTCEENTSNYVLFIKRKNNLSNSFSVNDKINNNTIVQEEYNVIPVDQWFRFKKPLNYRTLTLEEAEALNSEKKRAAERWLMKHKTAAETILGNDTIDETFSRGGRKSGLSKDIVSEPKICTGAVTIKKNVPNSEDIDIFNTNTKTIKRPTVRRQNVINSDPTGDDGGDFEEKFDDDESDTEIASNMGPVVESESEDEEYETTDPTGTKLSLLTGPVDIQKKNSQNYDNKKDKKENGNDDDNDVSEEDTENTNHESHLNIIKRDLGGNIIRTEINDDMTKDTNKRDHGVAFDTTQTPNKRNKNGIPDNLSVNATTIPVNNTSSSVSSSHNITRLTEAGVQQELIRYGGRMKTRDLLKKLKKLLINNDDKALLRDILRTICTVEKDPIDGNVLVLKQQFR